MSDSNQFESCVKGRQPILTKHARWRGSAKALGLSKRARLRLEWVIYQDQKRSAALTMRHFGLSSKVFYHWLNRFDELDLTSLEDRSRRPHTLRTKQYTATQASRMQQLHYDKPLVERFNGILQQEFVNLGNFHPDPDEFNPDLTEWLIYYNFVRPHHSLGLKRPAEFANMKAARVLPMWSPITKPSRIEQESV